MKTKVLFRMFQGELLALFPEDPGTNDPATCSCYAHVGQHGSADPLITRRSRPATAEDYLPLKRELESIGYNLHVIKRTPSGAYRTRALTIAASRKS